MRQTTFFLFSLIFLSSFAFALSIPKETFTIQATATAPQISLFVAKTSYNQNESMEIFGSLYQVTATSGVASAFSPLTSKNVTVWLTNSSGNSQQYNFTTDVNGSFYSNSSLNPSSTVVRAPMAVGPYTLTAQYNTSISLVNSSVTFQVANQTVDALLIQPNKAEYSVGENVTVTFTALRGTGLQEVRVANFSVNATLRYRNETILSSRACTTGSNGTCVSTFSAPSSVSAQSFLIEANGFFGFALFNVATFSVSALVMDSNGKELKDVFSSGDSGTLSVRVSINGSVPASGNFTVSASLGYANGTRLSSLSSVFLETNNSFTNQTSFSVSGLEEGTYVLNVTAISGTGVARNQLAFVQVKSWTLMVDKAVSNSGFQYGDITLPSALLRFEALVMNRSSGLLITGLSSLFSYQLKSPLGIVMANGTAVTFNASCGSFGCYEFNLTSPSTVGTYYLTVSVTHGGVIRSQSLSVLVNGLTVTAGTTDGAGLTKAVFSFTEFLNVNFTAQNATATLNVTAAEVISVFSSNGTVMNYSYQSNVSTMNATDSRLEWGWNTTTSRLVLDVPKFGGLYSADVSVNNQSAQTSVRFFSNPYDTCISTKNTLSESTADYFWQFKPSDTIYLQLTVTQADNPINGNTSSIGGALTGASYGRSSQCFFDTARKQSVTNATISLVDLLNLETGRTVALNTTASTCQSLSTQGHYRCTLSPNATSWETGRYHVNVGITSSDGTITDTAVGYFAARNFFVYGYAASWLNKPFSNVSLQVQAYEPGDGWWSSSSGLAGTVTLQAIEYLGSNMYGQWQSTGTNFNYNTTDFNGSSLTNGQATIQIPVNRTPNNRWDTGSYRARLLVTASDGRVDYGDVWFEVRYWDAWAQPVTVTSSSIQYRYSSPIDQNVSLYVRLTNAGDYSDNGGSTLSGNVTVTVKKLQRYDVSGWSELSSSQYTSIPIRINRTSPYPNDLNYVSHILNLTPNPRFPIGQYNVVLELNGTINGTDVRQQSSGWFTIKAFHTLAIPVNLSTGAYSYMIRGGSFMGFNVTSALDERNSYTDSFSSLINTTIVGVQLYQWTPRGQVELKYPQDLNFTPRYVNGTSSINVSRMGGNWSSGWYGGQLTLQDNQSNQQVAYVYFSVKPFYIPYSTPFQTRFAPTENIVFPISIVDPVSQASLATSTSNYTITNVTESIWTGIGQQTRQAVIVSAGSWNGTLRNVTVSPPTATNAWAVSPWGYVSLEVTVRDNADNSTDSLWLSSQIQSFSISATLVSSQNIATSANATLNLTLRLPNATSALAGNLTSVRYWDYAASQYVSANVTVGSCIVNSTNPCLVNSTRYYDNSTIYAVPVTVNVTPSRGFWPEGYNYLDVVFSDSGRQVMPENPPYFNARLGITGSAYPVNPFTRSYKYQFTPGQIVGTYVYGLTSASGSSLTANVTNVDVYSGNEWRDSLRTYSNLSAWNVSTSNNQVSSAGAYVNATPPSGGWSLGANYLRISLVQSNSSSNTGAVKGIYFNVVN